MLNELCVEAHKQAKEKGFYNEHREIGTLLMLIVSELSEALEAHRKIKRVNKSEFALDLNRFNEIYKKSDIKMSESEPFKQAFELHVKDTFEDEIADVAKRLFDLCGYMGIDLDWHLEQKTKYNKLRPHKHGKSY